MDIPNIDQNNEVSDIISDRGYVLNGLTIG
jgi:hypothetical protein